ncbi:hypothetical protein [Salinimonas iocasae]|uniref:Uncharacterized protein n=1 Tax=Salinimonas iocasae TaxID=2572577 RepID=A0A5B7YGG2_9ALTE|nr:hypothetical protein [Salinimonas iocasae]QCZ94674.1 hypothetical protein FBQ74_14890 [Salinimonas iocasae]
MIRDFSEYITQHMTESGLSHRPLPGEHHFVSIYLVPRLYRINKRIPDYVNPDGTKKVIGDVVYYKDHEHQLGIEVKLGTVRLTKNEFNTWIVSSDEVEWPHTFLGVGKRGLVLSSWKHFRDAYLKAVNHKMKDWAPKP